MRAREQGGRSAPAAYGVVQGSRAVLPITSGVGGRMTVVNYEMVNVGNALTGSAGWSSGGQTLNPGILENWPWLASVAQNFQKFRWTYLRFIFVPQTPTTTPGSVWLNMTYDPRDTNPADLQAVSMSDESVIGNAWYGGPISPEVAFSKTLSLKDAIYLDVDCARFTQPWYLVRTTNDATKNVVTLSGTATGGNGSLAVSSGTTYDYASRPGTIFYGCDDVTNSVVTGNLYMAYACELFDPIKAAYNA